MSDYNFPTYNMATDEALGATAQSVAPAAGAGISWGSIGASAGASALTGILTQMYQQEQERKKKIEDAQKAMAAQAGQYGQNQNNILGSMMNNWSQALGK